MDSEIAVPREAVPAAAGTVTACSPPDTRLPDRAQTDPALKIRRGEVTVFCGELRQVPAAAPQGIREPFRTLQFELFSPLLPEHSRQPLSDPGEKERIRTSTKPRLSSGKAITMDKLETRELAAELNILPQPPYLNLGTLAGAGAIVIRFQTIDLSSLPLAFLFSTPQSATGIQVDLGPASITLNSNSGVVSAAFNDGASQFHRSFDSMLELEDAVKNWCNKICPLEYVAQSLGELRLYQFHQIIEGIPDGVWYLKDINGSMGRSVARLTMAEGTVRSLEFAKETESSGNSVTSFNLENLICARKPQLPPIIDQPILEQSIPVARIDGILAEPRAVFCFNGAPQFLCSYSKVARSNEIFPNRSLGGDAEPTRESFRRILTHYLSDAENVTGLVEDTYLRYRDQLTQFARRFNENTLTRGFHYGPIFAVDTCPVWNNQTGQIDFWLIEVQANPGTTGALGNIAPDEQTAVDHYNRQQEEWESMNSMY